MKALIIEDEKPAARHLSNMVAQSNQGIEITDVLESVESAIQWFGAFEQPDLIFMDIQLADGLSFEIFEHVKIVKPIIFTTAFDQYALDAFKVNSIDYLLKPIDKQDLWRALEKYMALHKNQSANHLPTPDYSPLLAALRPKKYKQRFLVKSGSVLLTLPVEDCAWFFTEDGLAFVLTRDGKRYVIDQNLDQLESTLDPSLFFRINRKFIVSIDAVKKIEPYFNSRLTLQLQPKTEMECLVSRDRVADFKEWLDS